MLAATVAAWHEARYGICSRGEMGMMIDGRA